MYKSKKLIESKRSYMLFICMRTNTQSKKVPRAGLEPAQPLLAKGF